MARISLRSILLICVYFVVCCSVYVSANLWVGWFVVFATATWMSFAIIRAFQTHDHFTLGFAVTGCAWLIIWLGFAIETPTAATSWNIRAKIFSIMNVGRDQPEFDASAPLRTYAHLHDLYSSGPMAIQTAQPVAPLWHNSIRLAICLSSLVVGLVGGMVFLLFTKLTSTNIGCDTSATETVDSAG